MNTNTTTLKLRDEHLEWKQIDGEIVALDTLRAEYLSVDGSGVELWHALRAGTTRDALIASLVERYAIGSDRAGADVDAFLDDLAGRDLLAT
jgi:hypothetical protein